MLRRTLFLGMLVLSVLAVPVVALAQSVNVPATLRIQLDPADRYRHRASLTGARR